MFEYTVRDKERENLADAPAGFNWTLTPPSPTNPLGNPGYPGWTSANGPNWVGYLTVKYNDSLLQTYNLADGGATVDADLVTPCKQHLVFIITPF